MISDFSKTTMLLLCGIFAAVTAICSFITIPLGFTPVPVNLGTLAVFLTGGLLGKKYGTVSMVVYVLLGAAGVPVFSGFRGGIGVLAGPTGGYIIGYIAAVFIIGALVEKIMRTRDYSDSGNGVKSHARRENITDRHVSATAKIKGSGAGRIFSLSLAMAAGLLVCYAFGTMWFMISTSTPLWASLLSCVIPFIPGDIIKIAAAALLVRKLSAVLPGNIG